MTITLPDDPVLTEMGETEILLDLACGSYAAGHVSRGVAARMAGLDRHAFDQALFARRIPSYDEERWEQDLETIRALRNL
jgi:predicted HTH domain antitoxin